MRLRRQSRNWATLKRHNRRQKQDYKGRKEERRSRRQVQGLLEEQKKMNTLREDYAKALDKFSDVFERAVVNLKENNRRSDLKDGTFYTILHEKTPEKLLAQYYR